MKNLLPPTWFKNPPMCAATRLFAFPSATHARLWNNSMGDRALVVDSITFCEHCDGYHVHAHPRDNTETRAQNAKIPASVEQHNAEMSARDTAAWKRNQKRQ